MKTKRIRLVRIPEHKKCLFNCCAVCGSPADIHLDADIGIYRCAEYPCSFDLCIKCAKEFYKELGKILQELD